MRLNRSGFNQKTTGSGIGSSVIMSKYCKVSTIKLFGKTISLAVNYDDLAEDCCDHKLTTSLHEESSNEGDKINKAELVSRMSNTVYFTNKRRKTCDKTRESSSLSLRRWEDLDLNILKKIFDYVSYYDLSRNVSSVCNSWQLACWDTLLWGKNTINLSALTANFGNVNSITVSSSFNLHYLVSVPGFFGKFCNPEKYNQMAIKLMKQLKSIMEDNDTYGVYVEHWRLSIRKVIIPYDLEMSDKHLLYIAERTPGLESLVLLGSPRITGRGFAKAICNWKNIKHIGLGEIKNDYFTKIIKAIGKNCRGLRTLDVYSFDLILQLDTAHALAESLPQVKTLTFEAASLYRNGVTVINENCLELEAIHFRDCYLKEVPFHCTHFMATDPTRLSFTLRLSGSKGHRKWNFETGTQCVEPNTQSGLSEDFNRWMTWLKFDYYLDWFDDELMEDDLVWEYNSNSNHGLDF